MSHRILKPHSVFFIHFNFFFSIWLIELIVQDCNILDFVGSLLFSQICWKALAKFSFQLFYFSAPESQISFLFITLFLYWYFIFSYIVYSLCYSDQLSSVHLLGHVRLFATPWTAAYQAFLSITNFQSLLKLMSIESVMPSNLLILCRPLLLPPSILPSIRVFSNESVIRMRWPKYWSFSFSISPSNEYSGLISLGLTCLILHCKELLRVFSNTTVQRHQFFSTQLAL